MHRLAADSKRLGMRMQINSHAALLVAIHVAAMPWLMVTGQ